MYPKILSAFAVFAVRLRPSGVIGYQKMSDLAAGKKAAAIKAVDDYVQV